MNGTTPTTQDTPDKGRLQINLVSDISAYPIQGAQISIFYTGVPEAQLEQLTTDSSGQTDTIDLAAPPLEYSLNPENEVQHIPNIPCRSPPKASSRSVLPVLKFSPMSLPFRMQHETNRHSRRRGNRIRHSAHTLYATYPPKIPEDDDQRPSNPERLS